MEHPDLDSALRGLVREVVREVLAEERIAQAEGLELLTTAEASMIAKVKPATLRTWIKIGQLKAHHAGRGLRISRSDLASALAPGARKRGAEKRLTPEARARRALERRLVGER